MFMLELPYSKCAISDVITLDEEKVTYYESGLTYVSHIDRDKSHVIVLNSEGYHRKCLVSDLILDSVITEGVTFVNCNGWDRLIKVENLY